MTYETIKLIYLHFAYVSECRDLAYFLWIIIIENLAFIYIAYTGAKAILGRNSDKIKKYLIQLIIFILIRVVTYFFMNMNM